MSAAVVCFSKCTPDRWSLRQVSREAGVAPSLITHFFGSWSGLISAVLGAVVDGFESALIAASARPGVGAEERLTLWIDLCLPDALLDDDVGGACLAFRALARHDPDLQATMGHAMSVMRSTLEPVLSALAAERGGAVDAAALADQMCSMVMGLRFEISTDACASPAEARAKLRAFVEARLPATASGVRMKVLRSDGAADPLEPAPLGDEECDGAGDTPH